MEQQKEESCEDKRSKASIGSDHHGSVKDGVKLSEKKVSKLTDKNGSKGSDKNGSKGSDKNGGKGNDKPMKDGRHSGMDLDDMEAGRAGGGSVSAVHVRGPTRTSRDRLSAEDLAAAEARCNSAKVAKAMSKSSVDRIGYDV